MQFLQAQMTEGPIAPQILLSVARVLPNAAARELDSSKENPRLRDLASEEKKQRLSHRFGNFSPRLEWRRTLADGVLLSGTAAPGILEPLLTVTACHAL